MYIEKIFVYLVVVLLALLIFRVWWNERRLSRMEAFMTLVGQHGLDVDKTMKALMDIMDRFFKGLRESIEKNKERENERKAEAEREKESQ